MSNNDIVIPKDCRMTPGYITPKFVRHEDEGRVFSAQQLGQNYYNLKDEFLFVLNKEVEEMASN